jgi:hypothetical protein
LGDGATLGNENMRVLAKMGWRCHGAAASATLDELSGLEGGSAIDGTESTDRGLLGPCDSGVSERR